MNEYLEGYDDALKSVPIVSAEYAALEAEHDGLKARIAELEKRINELTTCSCCGDSLSSGLCSLCDNDE